MQPQEKHQPCKGFLLSCDKNRQKQALKDAYNFLTQEIYTDLTEQHMRQQLKAQGLEVTLQTEMAYNKKIENRLLMQLDTKCIIFIRINPKYPQIDPNTVVNAIMQDVHQNQKQVTRYCHRILPVERAFRAEHFKMLDQIDQLFNQHSKNTDIKSWALNFKCRNNSKFNYKQVLKESEKIAKKYNHFVDVYYPEWTLSIEITHHLMCISISEKFKQTNQYKLHTKAVEDKRKQDKLKQQDQVDEEDVIEPIESIVAIINDKQPHNKTKQQQDQPQKAQQPSKLLTEIILNIDNDDIDLL